MIKMEKSISNALETYSNVHRGSGFCSKVSTALYERSRTIVLEYLKLDKKYHTVIFCSPRNALQLTAKLPSGSFKVVPDLPDAPALGVRALVVKNSVLKSDLFSDTGGGTARLVAAQWTVWAHAPERLEAGTPSVIPVIALSAWLQGIIDFSQVIRFQNDEPLTISQLLYDDECKDLHGKDLMVQLRGSMLGRDLMVPTVQGQRTFVNFDNAASTSAFLPVWQVYRQVLHQPESVKQDMVAAVREICSTILGAPSSEYQVIFTSNTTESINLLARAGYEENIPNIEKVVVSSLLEHTSNDLPWRRSAADSVLHLSFDSQGYYDLEQLRNLLEDYNSKGLKGNKRIKLVTLNGASNVTGTYNHLDDISKIVHDYGALLAIDGAQMVAHYRVNIKDTGIDALAFSAHKVYAPFGCGVLILRKGTFHLNVEDEDQIRISEIENAAAIAALGKSLLLLERIGFEVIQQEEKELTARALEGLRKIKGITVYGICEPSSRHFQDKGGVIPFNCDRWLPPKLATELAARGGIGIRTGCFCAHMAVKKLYQISPALIRFQKVLVTVLPKISLPGMARISFGIGNTPDEVDHFLTVLAEIVQTRKTATNATYNEALQTAVTDRIKMVFGY